MTQTEALPLALWALNSVLANHKGPPVLPWIEARDAIKAALEAKDEPVAYIRVSKTGNVMACAKSGNFYALPDKTLLYTAPPPCSTCEALARTVMMDQTGRDA